MKHSARKVRKLHHDRVIAEEAMKVAAGICVYTNEQLTFEELP
jgi:ATP-dependent protease HslVU (ClpYQ) peptidase subunit